MEKICPVCKLIFTTTKNAQKFCSDACKKIAAQKTYICAYCLGEFVGKKRKYCSSDCRLKAEGRIPDDSIEIERIKPKLSLSEVAKLATEAGLTYGQYVQKHKLK